MTKIKIAVEIELPDDHLYGVSEFVDNGQVITKDVVALMVHQNLYSLLNGIRCDNMVKRMDHMVLPDADPAKPYLLRHNAADQNVLDQIVEKGKIKVVYDGGETPDY